MDIASIQICNEGHNENLSKLQEEWKTKEKYFPFSFFFFSSMNKYSLGVSCRMWNNKSPKKKKKKEKQSSSEL